MDDALNDANNNRMELGSLDESIMTTLTRDLKVIFEKTKVAMLPMKADNSAEKLKDWDFWGPLFFCLFLGLILSIGRSDSQKGIVFILIFAIVWIGGGVISLNSQFLGANLSVYQCICILGYCMFAIVVAATINSFTPFLPIWIHFVFTMLGFGYSSYASVAFVSQVVSPAKKILVSYPIFLFYLFLAWFTLAK